MSGRTYNVGAVAEVGRVTVRTLHHYDEIGLLRPSGRSAAGYRQYTRADLERLQQIRFYRHLGLSLEEIRAVLDAPGFDARRALLEHREKLVARIEETAALVATIDSMLAAPGRSRAMSNEELFEGFRPEEHEAEAEERWGDTAAWREAKRRTASYGPQQWREIKAEHDAIVEAMAALAAAGAATDSEEAQAAVERHRRHIDRWFYACSPAMHAGLTTLYVSDPRFAEAFDRHGEGLSEWVAEAIRARASVAGEARW